MFSLALWKVYFKRDKCSYLSADFSAADVCVILNSITIQQ